MNTLPDGFSITPTGCVRTPALVVIGGAYQRPPLAQSYSADVVQRLLLDREAERIVRANRERYDGVRLAPLRRHRRVIPVGGGWPRKVWLVVRDTARWLMGPRP